MAGRCPSRAAVSNAVGPSRPYVKWSFPADGPPAASAAVGANGAIYFGCSGPNGTGYNELRVLTPDGPGELGLPHREPAGRVHRASDHGPGQSLVWHQRLRRRRDEHHHQ